MGYFGEHGIVKLIQKAKSQFSAYTANEYYIQVNPGLSKGQYNLAALAVLICMVDARKADQEVPLKAIQNTFWYLTRTRKST